MVGDFPSDKNTETQILMFSMMEIVEDIGGTDCVISKVKNQGFLE